MGLLMSNIIGLKLFTVTGNMNILIPRYFVTKKWLYDTQHVHHPQILILHMGLWLSERIHMSMNAPPLNTYNMNAKMWARQKTRIRSAGRVKSEKSPLITRVLRTGAAHKLYFLVALSFFLCYKSAKKSVSYLAAEGRYAHSLFMMQPEDMAICRCVRQFMELLGAGFFSSIEKK